MYFVYFLHSKRKNNVYVGCTCDLERRLAEHNKGLVKSTKSRAPLTLIYYEKYDNLPSARRREDYFKSLYGARKRKEIIDDQLKKLKV
ncbi:MAG: GIY-YIG nuclease family protein [Candidatus Staskawiczbacteria bacterium]|nr:GIY-YIG nuclease family protein [Candidatus Staskawiczbacteria bacterium]